jgi:butyryl-CoA dehydrogenase
VSRGDDARHFAESVAGAADRALPKAGAPWRPGEAQDDSSPALSAALEALDWLELAGDPALAPFAGPAGFELGRRLAPVRDVDALLGAGLLVSGLIRYGGDGTAVELGRDGLVLHEVERSEPRAYSDSVGVHAVLALGSARTAEPGEAAVRISAWTAATVGYMAGVGAWALEQAVEYTRSRRAFGSTLAALPPVQQHLADAATAVRGVRLLAGAEPGPAALAHAGPSIAAVTATCQQVVGAIGFTLEFPLQRAFRRARTLQVWAEPLLG